jgi:chemotaxis protein methyltransferase CheR
METQQMVTMSGKDFSRLKEFIYTQCGINLTDIKRTMLEARLQKRLRILGLLSFSVYCDYLFSRQGMEEELIQMIDVVTTNKTDFFREAAHFEYLTHYALPELMRVERFTVRRPLAVWSAGCSSGEEPYTLAMVVKEFSQKSGAGLPFTILATDISTNVLEKAKLAIYEEEKVLPVPPELKRKYLLKSKDPHKKVYRIVQELRESVSFRRLNFMDGDFGFREHMDIIFCRNVIIYFDKPTQEKLLNRFCDYLSPDGYIFMGHSETVLGMDVPLAQVASTVYRRSA